MNRIHHHTLLEERGGTTAVAKALMQGRRKESGEVRHTYEIYETTQNTGCQVRPVDVHKFLRPEDIFHIHASSNLPALISSARQSTRRLMITLHDSSLLTGGCIHPLSCPEWEEGCQKCPRGIPHARKVCMEKRSLLTGTDLVVVSPSKWLGDQATHIVPSLSPVIIPNGIAWPDHLADKAASKKALGIHPEAKTILFQAFGGEKDDCRSGSRWRLLFEKIKHAVPGSVAMFAGGEDLDRQGDILFYPYLQQDQFHVLLSGADILIYPSLADNHPLTVLEAMAHGVCVLSFATGGIPEQITQGKTGLLVETGRYEVMIKEAIGVLKEGNGPGKLGAAAYYRGRKYFTRERMFREYGKVYRNLSKETDSVMVGHSQIDGHGPEELFK